MPLLFMKIQTASRHCLGVTLIELLAVLVLVGSLLAICVPLFANLREHFARTRNMYSARVIASAVARFHLEGHTFTNLTADTENNVALQDIISPLYAVGYLQHTNIQPHQILVKFYPSAVFQHPSAFPADMDGVLYIFPTKDP